MAEPISMNNNNLGTFNRPMADSVSFNNNQI